MAKTVKKGIGGYVTPARKALHSLAEDVVKQNADKVKKVPTSKFDRLRSEEERSFEKSQGLTPEERNTDRPTDFGEYDRKSHGLSLEETEALDDKNRASELKREGKVLDESEHKRRQLKWSVGKQPPEASFPSDSGEKFTPAKEWRGYQPKKRGGGVELGKVEGAKGKRRADRKAR